MAELTTNAVLSAEGVARARKLGLPLAYDCGLNGWVLAGEPSAVDPSRIGRSIPELSFRPWDLADLATYTRLLRDPEVWRFLPESYPEPFTEETARGLMEVGSLAALHDVVAVIWRGRPIGQCVFRPNHGAHTIRSAEVGYWLGREYWGRGIMTRVLPAFTWRCFDLHDVDVLYALIRPDHPASSRVAERAGYRRGDPALEQALGDVPTPAGVVRYATSRSTAPRRA